MEYLPVGWRIRHQWVLVVGGGEAALSPAQRLHEAGARLRVVAPSINAELGELAGRGGQAQHLDPRGAGAVYAGDNDPPRTIRRQHQRIVGQPQVGFNVWPYTQQTLEDARHPHELTRGEGLTLNVDYAQMGVGGDNSWGARPHDQYELHPDRTYTYSFRVEPLRD